MEHPIHIGHVVSTDQVGSSLHEAAKKGHKNDLKKILERGIFVDYPNDEGQTPLFCACCENQDSTAKLLLKYRANPNERTNCGMTPLHMTCYNGNVKLLVKLIEAGGDLRLHDYDGRSPKDWALANKDSKKRLKMLEFIEKSHNFAVTHSGRDLNASIAEGTGRIPSLIQMFKQKVGLYPSLHIDPIKKVQSMGFGSVYQSGGEHGVVSAIPVVNENSLHHDSNGVTYENGSFLVMESMFWNTTAVTVKRLHKEAHPGGYIDVLITEMEMLGKIRHPNVLLLMGVCQTTSLDSIVLIFERNGLGSLYYYLHQRVERLPTKNITDILLQICSAMLFLHDQQYFHCGLSSHAVNLVTPFSAKLGNFEHMIDSSKADMGKKSAVSQIKNQNTLYNWMAPELMQDSPASYVSDVYSFSCIMWEMFECTIPWDMCEAELIKQKLLVEKQQLKVDSSKMPALHKSIATIGLKLDPYERSADFDKMYNWLLGNHDEPISKKAVRYEQPPGKHFFGRRSLVPLTDADSPTKVGQNSSANSVVPNAPYMEEYSRKERLKRNHKHKVNNDDLYNEYSPGRKGAKRHRVKIMEDEFSALECMANRRQKERSFGKIPFSAGDRDWMCNVQRRKDPDFYSYTAQLKKDVSPPNYATHDRDATCAKQYVIDTSSDSYSDEDDVAVMKKYVQSKAANKYQLSGKDKDNIDNSFKVDYQRRDPLHSPPRSAPVSPRHFSYLEINQTSNTSHAVVKPASHCTEAGYQKTSGQLTTAGSLFALYNSGTDLNQLAKQAVGENPYATFPRNTRKLQHHDEEYSPDGSGSPGCEDPRWFAGKGSVKNLVHLFQDQADTHQYQQNILDGKVTFSEHANNSMFQKLNSSGKSYTEDKRSNHSPPRGLEYKSFVEASGSPQTFYEASMSKYNQQKRERAYKPQSQPRNMESDSQESLSSMDSSPAGCNTDQCSSVDSDLLSSWITDQLKKAKAAVEQERAREYKRSRYQEENDGDLLEEIMEAMSKPKKGNQYPESRDVYGRRKEEFDLKEYYIDDDISGDSDERSHIKLHGNLEYDKQKRDWKYKMRSKSDMRSTIGKETHNRIEKKYKRDNASPKCKAVARPMTQNEKPPSKGFTTTVTVESSLAHPGEHHFRHITTDLATGETKLLHQETVQATTVRSTLEA